MVSSLLLLLDVAFVASIAYLLLVKQGRRHVLLDRLHFRRRRTSGSKTPPRSLSPTKNQDDSSLPDYPNVYPPCRRFTLAQIPNIASKLGKVKGDLTATPEEKNCVPLTMELQDARKTMHTPCGFTVEEIEALGDFPDYATLSGVPLPQPYNGFILKKAIPRPYRPFRWAYHQTMCK